MHNCPKENVIMDLTHYYNDPENYFYKKPENYFYKNPEKYFYKNPENYFQEINNIFIN